MNEPRFTPMHPQFPFLDWRAMFETCGMLSERNDDPAPMSFTSCVGADFPHAPMLTWGVLDRIWLAERRREPLCCDVLGCKRQLAVYGFAAQMARAVVARACFWCKLRYLEPLQRDELGDLVRAWGFKDFRTSNVFSFAQPVQGHGAPSSADEARRQLLEAMLPENLKGGHLG